MNILADENIALVQEAFGPYGKLRTIPGRSIDAAMLVGVDALIVRSVTPVNPDLFLNSPCTFVGTATSGIEHVQVKALEEAGIRFAHAQGGNAESVVDYVLAALAYISTLKNVNWLNSSVGVVGCGQVGSRLVRRLHDLGLDIKVYDPYLPSSHELAPYMAELSEVLAQGIVSIHSSLSKSGTYPSFHMLNAETLKYLRKDVILINAARGGVVDSEALLNLKLSNSEMQLVLDAWENEPLIKQELLACASIATPHIAGYSRSGKLNGTIMIREAFCQHFALDPPTQLSELPTLNLAFPDLSSAMPAWQRLNRFILDAYDIVQDHSNMQQVKAGEKAGEIFDGLRRHYPERREFSQYKIDEVENCADILTELRALGFKVTS